MPSRRYRGPLRNSPRRTDRVTGRILDLILIGFGISVIVALVNRGCAAFQ